MEQTALRPKPMPGQEPGGSRPSGTARRPHAARRRGKRLMTLLFSVFVGTVLVLSGVGLGTVGATVIAMSKLADLQKGAGAPGPSGPSARGWGSASPSGSKAAPADGGPAPAKESVRATLGVEAVDSPKSAGALVVGVHVPGPGYSAGLVRGDVLLALGENRIGSAADLVRALANAHPGTSLTLTVRHANGSRQQLSAVPGVMT